MSAWWATQPKAVTMNVRERTRGWMTPLNLHYAGAGLLAAVNLYLLVMMLLTWQRVRGQDADALARQQVQLKTAQIAAAPLQGLDAKLTVASARADEFYRDRLPVSYSEVLTEMGALAKRQGVRLAHVNYKEAPVAGEGRAAEGDGQLTEIQMDATLSGDYRPLVLFLNGLERDKVFFLITGVTLTGQQSGVVNLRVRVVTYRRGLGQAETLETAQEKTPLSEADDAASAQAAGGRTR